MRKYLKNKPISSALIMCRPSLKGFLQSSLLEFCLHNFFQFVMRGNKALCLGTVYSSLGTSALIILPYSTSEMKNKNRQEREKELLKGLDLARKLGAEKIAFAGLLPSLFNHFHNLKSKDFTKYKKNMITGQIMTCIGISALFEKILKNTSCRTLSLIGVGSIGTTCLHLLLKKIIKPKKIILCDLIKKKSVLKNRAEEIEKTYSILTETVFYEEDTFLKVYEGDLFLGAVSSRNVLNPLLLKPGSILVDDSFPPIVSIKRSIQRMKNQKDILILSGGRMKPSSCHFQSHFRQIPNFLISFFIKQIGDQGLPGCWLEALLSSKLESLLSFEKKNFEGEQEDQTNNPILKIWDLKETLDIKLPDFHLFKYQIAPQNVSQVFKLRQKNPGKLFP